MSKLEIVASDWQKEYKNQIEYYTYDCYKSPLKDIIAYFCGAEIDQIDPIHIKTFINELIQSGKSRQTVNLRLIVLRHIFRYAKIEGLIEDDPTTPIYLPRHLPKTKRDIPTDEIINRIKTSPVDNQYWMMAKCLLFLGCRRGEMLALSKDSIDLTKNIITINKQIEYHSTTPLVKYKTKTQSSNRQIIIPDKLRNDLKMFCMHRENYLFISDNGNLLKSGEVRKGWNNLELGITMHQLRHAYATILYEAGIDEKMAQELMGHSSIVTLKNIYTHVRESQLAKAAIQLNEYL